MAVPIILPGVSGDVQARYMLGRRLGKGSFGVVFECVDKRDGRQGACKVIDKAQLRDNSDVEDVRREVLLLRQLAGHPGIVELRDVYEDSANVYMIMELCDGGDLFDEIKDNGPMPEEVAARVFSQLVSAIAFCHAYGVMHRDIKPENIFFLKTGERSGKGAECTPTAKLGDFGLAVVLAAGGTAGGLAGSRYYTAPEMVRAKRYGKRADVWSLGVVLCTMLTGRLPFAGRDHEDDEGLRKAIVRGRVNFEASAWKGVSDKAKDLVRRLLSVDPRQRPKSCHVSQHPWLAGLPGTAPTTISYPVKPVVVAPPCFATAAATAANASTAGCLPGHTALPGLTSFQLQHQHSSAPTPASPLLTCPATPPRFSRLSALPDLLEELPEGSGIASPSPPSGYTSSATPPSTPPTPPKPASPFAALQDPLSVRAARTRDLPRSARSKCYAVAGEGEEVSTTAGGTGAAQSPGGGEVTRRVLFPSSASQANIRENCAQQQQQRRPSPLRQWGGGSAQNAENETRNTIAAVQESLQHRHAVRPRSPLLRQWARTSSPRTPSSAAGGEGKEQQQQQQQTQGSREFPTVLLRSPRGPSPSRHSPALESSRGIEEAGAANKGGAHSPSPRPASSLTRLFSKGRWVAGHNNQLLQQPQHGNKVHPLVIEEEEEQHHQEQEQEVVVPEVRVENLQAPPPEVPHHQQHGGQMQQRTHQEGAEGVSVRPPEAAVPAGAASAVARWAVLHQQQLRQHQKRMQQEEGVVAMEEDEEVPATRAVVASSPLGFSFGSGTPQSAFSAGTTPRTCLGEAAAPCTPALANPTTPLVTPTSRLPQFARASDATPTPCRSDGPAYEEAAGGVSALTTPPLPWQQAQKQQQQQGEGKQLLQLQMLPPMFSPMSTPGSAEAAGAVGCCVPRLFWSTVPREEQAATPWTKAAGNFEVTSQLWVGGGAGAAAWATPATSPLTTGGNSCDVAAAAAGASSMVVDGPSAHQGLDVQRHQRILTEEEFAWG